MDEMKYKQPDEDKVQMIKAFFNQGVEEATKLEFELQCARAEKKEIQTDLQRDREKQLGYLEIKDELLMEADVMSEFIKDIAKFVDKQLLEKVERGEMHIDICAAAGVVHENAVAHGWWEGERDPDEVKALIHSEWSEALEEARAGRPMEWKLCKAMIPANGVCTGAVVCNGIKTKEECIASDGKPEGIAVELIDGVIRILDFMAYKFFDKQEEWDEFSDAIKYAGGDIRLEYGVDVGKVRVYKLVEILHDYTSLAREGKYSSYFGAVVGAVFEWLKEHGVNPEAVLLRKHAYNVTRPYKHGKKF